MLDEIIKELEKILEARIEEKDHVRLEGHLKYVSMLVTGEIQGLKLALELLMKVKK